MQKIFKNSAQTAPIMSDLIIISDLTKSDYYYQTLIQPKNPTTRFS